MGLQKISCLPEHLLIFPQSYLHPGLNNLQELKLIALLFSRLEKKKKSLQVKLYKVYKMTVDRGLFSLLDQMGF